MTQPALMTLRGLGAVVPWLRVYRSAWFRADRLAGLMAAAVVLPKAMAYATIAGLPVEVGLSMALVPMVVYALLGSSRPLSVCTTNPLAILVGWELQRSAPGGSPAELRLAALTPRVLEVAKRSELGRRLGRERLVFNLERDLERYGPHPPRDGPGGAGGHGRGPPRHPHCPSVLARSMSGSLLPAPGNRLVDGIARVLIALVFLHALFGKLTGFGAVAGRIAAKGLPFPSVLLGAAVVLLAAGSALLVSGWRQRLGAVLLLAFLIPTTVIFHGEVGDPLQRIQFLKNVAIIGALVLVANRPDSRR